MLFKCRLYEWMVDTRSQTYHAHHSYAHCKSQYHSHSAPHVKYRLVYVTVVDKTKYSTIARRTPLLATAPNMKNTYNGLMFVGAEGTDQ